MLLCSFLVVSSFVCLHLSFPIYFVSFWGNLLFNFHVKPWRAQEGLHCSGWLLNFLQDAAQVLFCVQKASLCMPKPYAPLLICGSRLGDPALLFFLPQKVSQLGLSALLC